jgi:hypothetical protein
MFPVNAFPFTVVEVGTYPGNTVPEGRVGLPERFAAVPVVFAALFGISDAASNPPLS